MKSDKEVREDSEFTSLIREQMTEEQFAKFAYDILDGDRLCELLEDMFINAPEASRKSLLDQAREVVRKTQSEE